MINFSQIIRHGDVLIYKLEEDVQDQIPSNVGMNKLILAEGEATGHSHKLEGDFVVLEEKQISGEVKFQVNSSALLTHEEHDRIVFDQGVYLKVNQVEYNPFTDLVKKVVD